MKPVFCVHKGDWEVRNVALPTALKLVLKHHYMRGASNTATCLHGLFPRKQGGLFDSVCFGVAWWIPPTKSAALATFPENWQGVLSLSRFVLIPGLPTNTASYLLGRSMRLIDRERWPCLVTYADDAEGHVGTIYRATNWTYIGDTKPEPSYKLNGRMVARKAGPHTRTRAEMLALGCEFAGNRKKHKFVSISNNNHNGQCNNRECTGTTAPPYGGSVVSKTGQNR